MLRDILQVQVEYRERERENFKGRGF